MEPFARPLATSRAFTHRCRECLKLLRMLRQILFQLFLLRASEEDCILRVRNIETVYVELTNEPLRYQSI